MSFLSQFVGGGGGFYNQRVITSSTTFTIPRTGSYLITAIGGGGAGGVNSVSPLPGGGGAGGFCQ